MPRIARKYMTVSFFHLMTQGINKENLREIVIRLKSKKISYRIMAEKLGIGRETLRRLNAKLSK